MVEVVGIIIIIIWSVVVDGLKQRDERIFFFFLLVCLRFCLHPRATRGRRAIVQNYTLTLSAAGTRRRPIFH